MAGRKSKKNLINTKDESKKWIVGVYCRLSSDDGDNSESDSIKNQKELINMFLEKEEDISIYNYYIDDGYSGTSFDRPSFTKMSEDIVGRRINMVIVKDLSRFGRNYIDTGRYLENIFPLYNIRFISINDNIDSFKNPESINSLIVPFKNILNDEYARDISNKVKSVYRTKALKGEFVGGTTPYGYKKDPENKYHLIIDEEEAPTVRLIFQRALAGDGKIKIAKWLNDNYILSRKEKQRRQKRGLSLDGRIGEMRYRWNIHQVGEALHNETYIGSVVQNKTTTVSYKNHQVIHRPKSEWIIVPNMHEPIINKKDFDKVQEMISERFFREKEATNFSLYRNKIICADCKRAMSRQDDHRGGRNFSKYYCSGNQKLGICSPHSINTEELDKIVLETILKQIKIVINLNKVINKYNSSSETTKLKEEYLFNINNINNNIEKYKRLKKSVYEDWKLGLLKQEEYNYYAKEYDTTMENLKMELKAKRKVYEETLNQLKKDDYWIEHFRRNKKIKVLSREVIDELIDKIYIHEDGNVTIKFKYQDEYVETINLVEKYESEVVNL